MKELSTDISRENWELKTDPRYSGGLFNHFQFLIVCTVIGIALLGGLLSVIFGEVIDSVSPEVQLLILLVACLTFSSIRGYLWIRKHF